jgi:hypothetical protein
MTLRLLLTLNLTLLLGEPTPPAFEEVGARVGLDFRHFNGMWGELYLPELTGAAVALIDYDNDGDLDVYLGQGNPIGDAADQELVFAPDRPLPLSDRLYRNDLEMRPDGSRTLQFTDVTEESGLSAIGYNMGIATGDFDNDGWVDLYLTNLGPNQLLRNNGDGTFVDVTLEAGVDDRRWSVPAVFFDFDRDGWLDLYVGNYHRFLVATHRSCFLANGALDYCGPLARPPEEDRLLRNLGDGTFQDVTAGAGLAGAAATALGAVAADFDGDGLVDLYVANDQMANHLWLNRGDGTFTDEAVLRGVAVNGDGQTEASMGIVAGDLNDDGAIDLFVSHLLREHNTLYLNDGAGLFTDHSWTSGLGRASWNRTGFGVVSLDFDGDGIDDLFVANGAVRHVDEQVREGEPYPLRMENQLFRGLGGGRFEEVPADQRQRPVYSEVSRGVAVGDVDNDGDPDLVVSNNAGPVRLLLNRRQPGSDWLGLRLLDAQGRRDVYGAQASISSHGDHRLRRAHTDGSFAAARDPRLLFSLQADNAEVVVRWPDGELEVFTELPAGRYVTLQRGTGAEPEGMRTNPLSPTP